MPFIEPLSDAQGQELLLCGRDTLARGLALGRRPPAPSAAEDPALAAVAACFVTLTREGVLRGCLGTLEARRPLLEAVSYFAYSAGFEDPRFEPLTPDELTRVRVEVSVLSPLELLEAESEAALLDSLTPGVDGLWLDAGPHCATFLPQVWSHLPDPRQFLAQLKRKAGLTAERWPAGAYWYRYRVSAFLEPA